MLRLTTGKIFERVSVVRNSIDMNQGDRMVYYTCLQVCEANV